MKEDIKNKRTKEEPNIVRDKIREYRIKAIRFIKKNPKNIFYGMIALTVISLVSNIFYYKYTVKNAKNVYNQMNDKIFNKDFVKVSNKQDASIYRQASDYFEMKKDLDFLKNLQAKKRLTKQDSLEAIRITNKYNLK